MENSISERMSLLITELKLNGTQLAKQLNYHASVVNNILKKRNSPSFDFISRLKQYESRIDLNWLISGDGEMFISDNANDKNTIILLKELVETQRRENDLLREKLNAQDESKDSNLKKENNEIPCKKRP